jgi:adenylyltransferase/sulfurtransferase
MLTAEEHNATTPPATAGDRRAGQLKLKNARVLIVGAGGLGCPVLQYLAAAGVGTLGIVDADKVDLSNLQRQILYGPADVGQSKAEAAARAVRRINPLVHAEVHSYRATLGNIRNWWRSTTWWWTAPTTFTRYLLNDACVSLNRPLVSGAIYKFEGQVSVFNFQGGPTYRCLFPQPPPRPRRRTAKPRGCWACYPVLWERRRPPKS